MTEALRSEKLTVPHGFLTRKGGVSEGPYASLNCSLSGQDSRDSVMENRARAVRAIRADSPILVGVTQVHGNAVARVTSLWPAGQGPRADAMVSDRADIALGIVTADCAPVLLADPIAGVIGAAHAGWRGAVLGILDTTVAAMVEIGAHADRITAVIGPCIAQTSYEVRADLVNAVVSGAPTNSRFFIPGVAADRWQFDLRGYCRARLEASGIGHVDDAAADTLADEDRFFSHRRRTLRAEGPIGHQISVIALG